MNIDIGLFQNLSPFPTQILDLMVHKIRNNSNIWIIGNGGSASTAEHFETDLSYIRETKSLPSVKAFALTSNSAVITAISNDIGYEWIFTHQLKRKANENDLVFIISASGNSENLLNAVEFAKLKKLQTIGLLGFDGGKLIKMVDFSYLVHSKIGLYGQVEDVHLAVCHFLAEQIKDKLLVKDAK